MTRITRTLTILIALSLVSAGGALQAAEHIRLGVPIQPTAALLELAHLKGYLKAQGLEVSVKTYPSGKLALQDGLFKDEVDVVSNSDVPFVVNSFERNDYVALAAINYLDDVNSIVARRDHGIATPSDLRGKRFGIQKASAVHYFAHLFLQKHHLTENDIEPVYMKGSDFPAAIAAGDIDAFSMREPHVSRALELLGDNAVVFTEPGLYAQYELVVGNRLFVKAHPEAMEMLIKGLIEAQDYARKNPDEAIAEVAAFLEADPRAVGKAWQSFSLGVTLDQAMLLTLEQEAGWVLDRGLTAARSEPNFLDYLYLDALDRVAPRAVTIFH